MPTLEGKSPAMDAQIAKLEQKIDLLTIAVNRLAVIDERQIAAGQRVGQLEDRVAKMEECQKKDFDSLKAAVLAVDAKVTKWINMGIGAWALAITVLYLYQTFSPLIHK